MDAVEIWSIIIPELSSETFSIIMFWSLRKSWISIFAVFQLYLKTALYPDMQIDHFWRKCEGLKTPEEFMKWNI